MPADDEVIRKAFFYLFSVQQMGGDCMSQAKAVILLVLIVCALTFIYGSLVFAEPAMIPQP